MSVAAKDEGDARHARYSRSDVVKLTAFVAGGPKRAGKMDFAGFNAAYKMLFGMPEHPDLVARWTVQVAALAGPYVLVAIQATVAKAPPVRK